MYLYTHSALMTDAPADAEVILSLLRQYKEGKIANLVVYHNDKDGITYSKVDVEHLLQVLKL